MLTSCDSCQLLEMEALDWKFHGLDTCTWTITEFMSVVSSAEKSVFLLSVRRPKNGTAISLYDTVATHGRCGELAGNSPSLSALTTCNIRGWSCGYVVGILVSTTNAPLLLHTIQLLR